MSDNKINSDSEEPLSDETPGKKHDKVNKPENDFDSESSKKNDNRNEKKDSDPSESSSIPEEKSENIEDTEVTSDGPDTKKGPPVDKETADRSMDQTKSKDKDKSEEKTLPVAEKPKPAPKVSKESNYQISLINQNLLKILVTPRKFGVKIESSVKDDKSLETQSNEICFYPKMDLGMQEVEVLIAIEAADDSRSEIDEAEMPEIDSDKDKEEEQNNEENIKSNYLISLINENLLRIKIASGNGVRIDSVGRDKKFSTQTQSNKIFLKQKPDGEIQEIEIKIKIETDASFKGDPNIATTEDGKIKLIPNPEVMDLIEPPDYSALAQSDAYDVDDGTVYRNPFDKLRKLIRKNLVIGLTAAVILHLAVGVFAFYKLSKKSNDEAPEEPQRLIVLQDLPDPRIKLENVEDPNRPKVEDIVIPEVEKKDDPREITPRRIVKPPEVKRPKREDSEEETKLDSITDANLNRALDSLRQLSEEEEFLDSNIASDGFLNDSLSSDSALSLYEIPDSLKNSFNENDIGLAMYFPKNWNLTDQREINKSEKEFKGVVITDTTAEQPGTMTMFIFLDNEGKDYNAEDFKTEFEMVDSTLNAFSKEPKTLAGFTEYRFYIFNNLGTEKLSIGASVRKQFFEQYKNEIEAVVRSINIKKKEDL